MAKTIIRTINLKEFVDFAYSIKEMNEVKEMGFPVPRAITFSLPKQNHDSLQKEILKEKKLSNEEIELSDEFEVEMYDITFKFIIK